MELLEKIFCIQRDFTEKIVKKNFNKKIEDLTLDEKQILTKDYTLNLFREIGEVLNCIKFKSHRDESDKDIIYDNLYEELIDVQKYLLGLMLIWDFDIEKFFNTFESKSKVVELRFYQEIILKNFKDDEVIICDIDGVLNDWPQPIIDFANSNGHNIKSWEQFLNLSIDIQDELKHKYRSSGLKQSQNVNKDVVDFLKYIKNNTNYKILILSSRPYEKYLRIFYDTQTWLEKNKIPCDGLYFDTKKHRKLLNVFSKIKLFIDDDKDFINQAFKCGINSVLFLNNRLQEGYYDRFNDEIKIYNSLNETSFLDFYKKNIE